MSRIEKLRQLVRQGSLFDLPIGVYVLTTEGRFVDCNRQAREILQLPPDMQGSASILDFYADYERERYPLEIELSGETEQWIGKPIRLRVNGREKFVKDYARKIVEPETNAVLGYLCCMVDVTAEEYYHQLYQSLPVGLYQLDENDRIIEISEAAVRMLDYASKDELTGRAIREFYADPKEEAYFREQVDKLGSVADQRVELQKKNGEPIYVSLSAFRITRSEEYIGQQGIMLDVTTEERYRRILQSLPLGLYVIVEREEKDIITACNEQFAMLFDFESVTQAIGFDAKRLHESNLSYDDYIRALTISEDKSLSSYRLPLKTVKGRDKMFEISSRLIFDRNGKRIGRAEAIQDISEKTTYRHKIEELTEDIGTVLHSYSAAIVTMHNSISAVLQSFESDPFKGNPNLLPEQASGELEEPAKRLYNSINQLIEISALYSPNLLREDWLRLSELIKLLQNYKHGLPYPESHPSILRTTALEVLNILNNIGRIKFPKDPLRQAKRGAQDVLRVCNLISLHQLLNLTAEMEHPMFALREFIITDRRASEDRTVCKISHLLSRAISNTNEFALSREVAIRYEKSSPDVSVQVVENEIIRAFVNLLHNAIKYSWKRAKGQPSWVSIRTLTDEGKLYIEFENWGVPIPKDEIEQGLIFQIGYRGRLSGDRGRVGTGIGLADSRRVAQNHGGEIIVKSRPAIIKTKEDDFEKPFLTTVIFILPLNQD